MLSNVGDPQLIWGKAVELAVDQIISGDYSAESFEPYRSGQSVDAGLGHQDRHRARAHRDTHAQGEFGVDASVSVGAAGGDVHFADQSGQPLAPQLCRGGRCALVFVVVLSCDAKGFAAAVNGRPGADESVDHRVEPFGRGLSSPRNFAACRTMDSSVSNSWI